MTRLRCLLLLTLIVGLSMTEVQKEDEYNTNSTETEAAVNADTNDTLILTRDICVDGHMSPYVGSHCCQYFLEIDQDTEYCMLKFSNLKVNDEYEKITRFSKVTECIYIRKKYMKSRRSLNMGHIKADAAKLHDPLAQKYMVKLYRDCGRQATEELDFMEEAIKNAAKGKHTRETLRKPYFFLVHRCFVRYSDTHQCPYFRWCSGEEDAYDKCANYSQKCKKMLKNTES